VTDLSADYLPPALVSLLAVAKAELDRHTNDHGRCAVCRADWPCEPACLTAFTLGSL
jgi:hypothetical protein